MCKLAFLLKCAFIYHCRLFLSDRDALNEMITELPTRTALKLVKLNALEFEKDDDTNFHMDFIVATSNLRAENYEIEPADRYKVQLLCICASAQ